MDNFDHLLVDIRKKFITVRTDDFDEPWIINKDYIYAVDCASRRVYFAVPPAITNPDDNPYKVNFKSVQSLKITERYFDSFLRALGLREVLNEDQIVKVPFILSNEEQKLVSKYFKDENEK